MGERKPLWHFLRALWPFESGDRAPSPESAGSAVIILITSIVGAAVCIFFIGYINTIPTDPVKVVGLTTTVEGDGTIVVALQSGADIPALSRVQVLLDGREAISYGSPANFSAGTRVYFRAPSDMTPGAYETKVNGIFADGKVQTLLTTTLMLTEVRGANESAVLTIETYQPGILQVVLGGSDKVEGISKVSMEINGVEAPALWKVAVIAEGSILYFRVPDTVQDGVGKVVVFGTYANGTKTVLADTYMTL